MSALPRHKSISTLRNLYAYIGPYRKRRFFITLLCALEIVVSTYIPFLLGRLVSLVEKSAALEDILTFGAFVMGVGFCDIILNVWQNYAWHAYTVEFENYFRLKMMEGAFSMSPSEVKKKEEDIHSRILNDGRQVASHIGIGLPMLVLNSLRIVLVLALMSVMSMRLACVMFVVVPLYTVFFIMTRKESRKNSRGERETLAVIDGRIKEILKGFFQIKIYQQEDFFLEKLQADLKTNENYSKKIKWFTAFSYGLGQIITVVLPIVVLVYGAYEVSQDRMELGALFSFYFYLSYLYEPLNNLADYFTALQLTLGMSDRVTNLIEKADSPGVHENRQASFRVSPGKQVEKMLAKEISPEYEDQSKDGILISSIDEICIENLSFSYDGKKPLLEQIDFCARSGDIIAVVGPTGSGKTSFLSLLLKIIEDYQGNILVNHMDLRKISRDSYYQRISYLGQTPLIFAGTLSENIAFAGPEEKHLQKVIGFAHLQDVAAGKSSEQILIDIDGENLSGGEQQRVAYARALYKDADLIILDEFTSALDLKTEETIVEQLSLYAKSNKKIVFIVSHRQKPLSICNKTIVIGETQ